MLQDFLSLQPFFDTWLPLLFQRRPLLQILQTAFEQTQDRAASWRLGKLSFVALLLHDAACSLASNSLAWCPLL